MDEYQEPNPIVLLRVTLRGTHLTTETDRKSAIRLVGEFAAHLTGEAKTPCLYDLKKGWAVDTDEVIMVCVLPAEES